MFNQDLASRITRQPQTNTTPVGNSNRLYAALETAENTLTTVYNMAEELEKRLSGILAPTAPSVDGNGQPAPSPVTSPLTERTNSINYKLNLVASILGDIMNRLEIS